MLAAALSGLLLMLVGASSPASAHQRTTAPADAGTSLDRAAAGLTKATVHKADVGARAHHDQSGLGPDLGATLPADLHLGSWLSTSAIKVADDRAHGTRAPPHRSRAPPR